MSTKSVESLIDAGDFEQAVRILKQTLVECSDPLEASFLAAKLGKLYRHSHLPDAEAKAIQYLSLSVEGFVREGEMLGAVSSLYEVREIPGALEKAKKLRSLIADSFSLKRVRKVDPDRDRPPPTPFQEIVAHVSIESDSQAHLQRSQLEFHLPSDIEFFSGLKSDELSLLLELGVSRKVAPNECIYREEDPSSSLYILISGSLLQTSKSGREREIKNGAFFGDVSYFAGSRRTATVIAKESSEVLEFQGAKFFDALKGRPSFQQKVWSFYERRLFLNMALDHPLFKHITPAQIHYIFDYFQSVNKPANTVVQQSGKPVSLLRFLIQGECKKRGSKESLGLGSFILEREFLRGDHSGSEWIIEAGAYWLEMGRPQFEKLCQILPPLVRNAKAWSKETSPLQPGLFD